MEVGGHIESDGCLVAHRTQLLDGLSHELTYRQLSAARQQSAGLNPIEDEDVLDKAAQPDGVALDHAEHEPRVITQRADVSIEQQIELALDRGQRGAQLRADRGE